MQKNIRQRFMIRLFILFIIITCLATIFGNWLDSKKIDHVVVIGANALLLLLTSLGMLLHVKAAGNPNPNVFVRSVMGATFIKLMSIIIVLAVYLFTAGANRSIYAVFAGMGIYVLYTIVEVMSVLELNKQKNGSN